MGSFLDTIEALREKRDNITDRETLKNFCIEKINEDMEFLAIHILTALQDSTANYFDYDYCMGTLDTPTPLETIEDLQDYIEE